METNRTGGIGTGLQGNAIRLSAHREVALYQRGGTAWVAEFIDGRGTLHTVGAWSAFKHNRSALRRIQESEITPLAETMAARIERLHLQDEASGVAPAIFGVLAGAFARLREIVGADRRFTPSPASRP
ncbi:MAG: hypothetical protein EXR27_05390 [Betaproteobacteria bacterium]|nr:hypothetical protein [Betaproteobacteria bacterium]